MRRFLSNLKDNPDTLIDLIVITMIFVGLVSGFWIGGGLGLTVDGSQLLEAV